ncbi:hypothetical protein LguiA_008535 [Lonicera macranthoides]
MEAKVESPESGRSAAGIAMEFPASDRNVSPTMPPRLRRRLSETKTSPISVEEIEAKLQDADLRRQKFYEKLSSKARMKPRILPKSTSQEEDIGQRLEAKLHAAEQKRLSMLAKSQMRLAKLDELRQAAKTGLEMRFKKERAELGTKVQSRAQQAEVNRMLILKSYMQRRATLKERTSQSLLRRIARENKYKERVRAAISQKRAAAEKKRLGLLEADMKRAGGRVLQVRKVVKSVSQQREIESRKLRDKLEDRLQRARRQRAEYLMQRARLRNSVHWKNMQKEADLLSRKIARCWRKFLEMGRTTLDLTKAYDALNINETHVKSVPFDQLALLIESASTLQTTKALLDRLESRYKMSQAVDSGTSLCRSGDIDHLLKQVATPKKRAARKKPAETRAPKKPGPITDSGKSPVQLSRYQARVVLCAYMILAHPDAVFSAQGECENALAKSAEKFVREFELLTKIILDGPVRGSDEESEPSLARQWTFRSQLVAFDAAWCSYLNNFAVWKVKDAESLEEDLVKAACELELSMIQKLKLTPEGDSDALTHDLKAIQKQVVEDQKLMRQKIMHLSGDAGIERMENALSDTRRKYFQARESGSPVGSPVMHILPPSSPTFPARPSSASGSDNTESSERPKVVARSLFGDDASFPPTSVPSSSSENLGMENELIVNEVVHEEDNTFADSFITDDDQDGVKEKIRETLKNAFWDGITESMKQNKPNYDRVVELMKEVRDEICEMAPQSWNQEITEAIDLDILSQVLNSGELDMDHLRKILEFALVTLQKLSAPANEDELKASHQELLIELARICQAGDGSNNSHVIALIKGLRFVLEQIQALKQEISKARIRIMEPILRGPAGMDYLRKAFAKRYGPPSDAPAALPLTMRWLTSVWGSKEQEWSGHTNSLSELKNRHNNSSQRLLPSTTLRAGGSFFVKSGSQVTSFPSTDSKDKLYSECKGEKVDLLVRLGVLKLVNGVSDVAQEPLPETLKLNLTRLRAVQAQLQKVIVTATSVLVLRQTLVSEQLVGKPEEMEGIVLSCINQLTKLLDTVEDAGIKEIIEILTKFTEDCEKYVDPKKLQSIKDVMATMLMKSLQAGDAVFLRVSSAVYLAVRGFVLGGGAHGRELTEMALRQVSAAGLTDTVVEAAKIVVVVATVSGGVHGPWYAHLLENI